MSVGSALRKLKKASAPAPAFRDSLRTQLAGSATRAPRVFLRSAMTLAVFVLVAVFGLGSYAYASPTLAEDTTLYRMKLRLENLESIFHSSPEAEARFRSKILQRRVREAIYRHEHGALSVPPDYQSITDELDSTVGSLEGQAADSEVRAEVRAEIEATIDNFRTRVLLGDETDAERADLFEQLNLRLNSLSL